MLLSSGRDASGRRTYALEEREGSWEDYGPALDDEFFEANDFGLDERVVCKFGHAQR